MFCCTCCLFKVSAPLLVLEWCDLLLFTLWMRVLVVLLLGTYYVILSVFALDLLLVIWMVVVFAGCFVVICDWFAACFGLCLRVGFS